MKIDEALELSDEWIKGVTLYEGAQGWRVACHVLATEVRRLTAEIEAPLKEVQSKSDVLSASLRIQNSQERDISALREERDALAAKLDATLNWYKTHGTLHRGDILANGIDAAAILAARDARALGPALDLLDVMFSAYEDGPDCYEDPDDCAGHLGKAVKIDDVTFHAIADLLNKHLPRMADAIEKEAGK